MKKATIEFEDDKLIVDGLVMTLNVIPQILYELAHPDPRKWYRFERMGDHCIVHVEFRDPDALRKQCPKCGYNSPEPFPFCPFDREVMKPMEVRNGNYVGERSRSSEDAGSEGEETTHPHHAHRPN